ncbi:MAG: hypothetical protein AAFN81_08390 [Bacteroidota bacterium]
MNKLQVVLILLLLQQYAVSSAQIDDVGLSSLNFKEENPLGRLFTVEDLGFKGKVKSIVEYHYEINEDNDGSSTPGALMKVAFKALVSEEGVLERRYSEEAGKSRKSEIEHHENGLPLRAEYSIDRDNSGRIESVITREGGRVTKDVKFTYDDKGRIIEYLDQGKGQVLSREVRYEYDDNDRIVNRATNSSKGNVERLHISYGDSIVVTIENFDQYGVHSATSRIIYTNRGLEYRQKLLPGRDTWGYTIKNSFDEEDRLISHEHFLLQGEGKPYRVHAYKYEGVEKKPTEIVAYMNGELIKESKIFYGDDESVVSIIEKGRTGSETTSTYRKDEHGNILENCIQLPSSMSKSGCIVNEIEYYED